MKKKLLFHHNPLPNTWKSSTFQPCSHSVFLTNQEVSEYLQYLNKFEVNLWLRLQRFPVSPVSPDWKTLHAIDRIHWEVPVSEKNVEPIKIQPPSHVGIYIYISYIYIPFLENGSLPMRNFRLPWRFRQHFARSALPGPGGSVGRGSHVPRGWSHLNVPRYPMAPKEIAASMRGGTVDGRNPANQLRLVVYPSICKVLAPSQVLQDFSRQQNVLVTSRTFQKWNLLAQKVFWSLTFRNNSEKLSFLLDAFFKAVFQVFWGKFSDSSPVHNSLVSTSAKGSKLNSPGFGAFKPCISRSPPPLFRQSRNYRTYRICSSSYRITSGWLKQREANNGSGKKLETEKLAMIQEIQFPTRILETNFIVHHLFDHYGGHHQTP